MAALTEENLQVLSPSAAAASKLLRSGLTFTQIYSQFVATSEKLLLEEAENKRLSDCLDTIMTVSTSKTSGRGIKSTRTAPLVIKFPL